MKKILFTILFVMGTLCCAMAQITPISQGTYKIEHVGGITDIFVKLSYSTDGTDYAYVLKCANQYNPNTFTLVLGQSTEEAIQSVDALLYILDNGNKGEIYIIDNHTTIRRHGKNMMYVHRDSEIDPGYIMRRHLTSTKKFLEMLL